MNSPKCLTPDGAGEKEKEDVRDRIETKRVWPPDGAKVMVGIKADATDHLLRGIEMGSMATFSPSDRVSYKVLCPR